MHRLLIVLVLLSSPVLGADEARLLRFADIHRDRVVFVHAGDLYSAPAAGGTARRLTSHEGLELFPKFSPDGKWIAFSGEYSGSRQVHLIPSDGGAPRQLTWYNDVGPMPPRGGFDYRVLDWTPDGRNVLVRANRLPWGPRMGRPYLVPVDGGMEQPLAVPEGGGGMLSPDGRTLVYTPIDREFRTWKRYRGGRAQDVWTFDLDSNEAKRLTDNRYTDNQPLWVGEDIYYASDRKVTLNLYRHVEDGEAEQVTFHEDFDVLWPSAGPEAIVYEAGGFLYRYDPVENESRRIEIALSGDWPDAHPDYRNVTEFVESWDVSPKGARAVFGARGELFSVPAEHGEIRNLSRSPDAREIGATWSPDGRWIAYLSDASGEYELYLLAQDGSGKPRRITEDGAIWRFDPVWSPDSKHLAFGDKRQRLNVVNVESGRVTVLDESRYNDIDDFAWAPDSRHLAYVKNNEAAMANIWIADLEEKSTYQLTASDTSETDPVFDPEGRYLYFLSNRDYNLTFSDYQFDYLYTDATRVYAGLLTDEAPPLFSPRSDEVSTDSDSDKGKDDSESDKDDRPFRIERSGFNDRVVALVDAGGDYRNLAANAQGVFWLSGGNGSSQLSLFNLGKREAATVLEGVRDYRLSAAGNKVLFRVNGSTWGIANAAPKQDAGEGHLDLERMEMRIDPRREWRQMFVDGWRIMRDWFYDPGMHGQDWEAIRDRYAPLVEHVHHRADLDYIFGELAGEMNAGHIYVQSGDQPGVERRENGLLGAELAAHESGYYRIERIFPGENWHEAFRSPLTEPGVDVAEGDFLLAIDGRSTRGVDNVYRLLENTAGKVVTLTVNGRASEKGAREVKVKPITSETNLRYLAWVADRKRRVDELSDGRIGYIHLPNTAGPGNRELIKTLRPQVEKDALIVDDRYNGGGFIPDRMIELLARERLNYWKRRGLEPQSTPLFAHEGPKVMLINGYSSSGGDALPYYFRKLGLGPLIGTRTWGGLIGISGNPGLADGGTILVSTFRFLDTDGNWAVENEGVAPDIEVVDRPDAVARGRDPSLERAVRLLLEQLEADPAKDVTAPPAPDDFR